MTHTLGLVSQAMLGRPSTHINHTTYHSTYHSTGAATAGTGGSSWWIVLVVLGVLVIAAVTRKLVGSS